MFEANILIIGGQPVYAPDLTSQQLEHVKDGMMKGTMVCLDLPGVSSFYFQQ